MAATAPALDLGRVVFGLSALAFGLVALAAPDYYAWLQLTFTNAQIGLVSSYIASAAQIAGGAAIAFPATAKTGAVILGAVYLAIALVRS